MAVFSQVRFDCFSENLEIDLLGVHTPANFCDPKLIFSTNLVVETRAHSQQTQLPSLPNSEKSCIIHLFILRIAWLKLNFTFLYFYGCWNDSINLVHSLRPAAQFDEIKPNLLTNIFLLILFIYLEYRT